MTIKIIGLSGSLRRDSLNTKLLRAAATELPSNASLSIHSLTGIPLYNFDDEATDGIPAAVQTIKDAIVGADGLLISTPEYNNSIPGVAKNAIDWLSRPPADIPQVFAGLPTALIGATPGPFGTQLAQNAWLPVMRMLGMNFWSGGRLLAPRASALFDEQGELTDAALRDRLAKFLDGFVSYIQLNRTR